MNVNELKAKLITDDRWLMRGVLAIWKFQTNEEKMVERTVNRNNVGFSGCDAILTGFGNQLNRQQTNEQPLWLSEKQLRIARRKMPKYAGQLLRIVENKQ